MNNQSAPMATKVCSVANAAWCFSSPTQKRTIHMTLVYEQSRFAEFPGDQPHRRLPIPLAASLTSYSVVSNQSLSLSVIQAAFMSERQTGRTSSGLDRGSSLSPPFPLVDLTLYYEDDQFSDAVRERGGLTPKSLERHENWVQQGPPLYCCYTRTTVHKHDQATGEWFTAQTTAQN